MRNFSMLCVKRGQDEDDAVSPKAYATLTEAARGETS